MKSFYVSAFLIYVCIIISEDMRAQKLEREAREQESLESLKESLKVQQTKTEAAEKSKIKAQELLSDSLAGIQDVFMWGKASIATSN